MIHPSGFDKRLPTACFSAHSYLHSDAAQLAINASIEFLNQFWDKVGTDRFEDLLSLTKKDIPSTVFVLDASASMKEEFNALIQLLKENKKYDKEFITLVTYGETGNIFKKFYSFRIFHLTYFQV